MSPGDRQAEFIDWVVAAYGDGVAQLCERAIESASNPEGFDFELAVSQACRSFCRESIEVSERMAHCQFNSDLRLE